MIQNALRLKEDIMARRNVVAIFENEEYAKNAAEEIKARGLKTADISIVARDGTSGTEDENKGVRDNISNGVITGGVLGGLAGLVMGAGNLVVPGLGIVAAAGPIAGLISGAVTGGIVGGLVDLGIPEEKSMEYEKDIMSGRILFSMRVDEENENQVAEILRNNGAKSVDIH